MSQIEFILIPRDEASVEKYIERYKVSRLYALQVAPEMYGSTYEEELEYDDKIWHDRLMDPKSMTWTALRGNDILGSITVRGPLQYHPDQVTNPWSPRSSELDQNPNPGYVHFSINGVFTSPTAQGLGIANQMMKIALREQIKMAADMGKELISTLGVDEDNVAACNLCNKWGYVQTHAVPRPDDGWRLGLLMTYLPDDDARALLS